MSFERLYALHDIAYETVYTKNVEHDYVSMVRCVDCGFCEPSPYIGNLEATCAEKMERQKKIKDCKEDIKRKKFVSKRKVRALDQSTKIQSKILPQVIRT